MTQALINCLATFQNSPQVKELLGNNLNVKTKMKIEIEYLAPTGFSEGEENSIALSLNIEKAQGYSGFRKVYDLNKF